MFDLYFKIIGFVVFVLLQFTDGYSTVRFLKLGGSELNKFANVLMDKIGVVPTIFSLKVSCIALVWYLLPSLPLWGLVVCNLFYVWVVYNNVSVIRKINRRNDK